MELAKIPFGWPPNLSCLLFFFMFGSMLLSFAISCNSVQQYWRQDVKRAGELNLKLRKIVLFHVGGLPG
jgi:hypothetical protein